MQKSAPVASAPLWRPVAAYALGIAIAANVETILVPVFAGLLLLLYVFFYKRFYYNEVIKSVLITSLFFMSGIMAAFLYEKRMPSSLPEDEAVYKCLVKENPYFKGKTWRCEVEVVRRMNSICIDKGACALLYLSDTSEHSSLKRGDLIYLNTSFSLPDYDEGYRRYLLNNYICGTAYIAPGNIHHIGHAGSRGLFHFAEECRDRVLNWYSSIGFSGDELAVLSALTLGVRNEISDKLKEDYSVSGASHVLALSGLHVGMIFLVLNLLFSPISLLPYGKFISWSAVTVILFAFAVFTGLSPSVVRACFMMAAFGFAGLIKRGGTSLNTLFLIALCLLVYNPMYISNVSFLLSFAAVLFILLFQPLIISKLRIGNRCVRYVVDLFVISIIAQIGVSPIVAYYFGSFSVFGVLSSVLIVPLLTVLMYVIILMLVFSWWPLAVTFFVSVISKGICLMNRIAGFFGSLPSASVDGLEPDIPDIILFYFVAVSLIYVVNGISPKRFRMLLVSVAAVLAVINFKLYERSERKEIVFASGFDGVSCRYVSSFREYSFDRSLPDTSTVRCGGMWQNGNMAFFSGKSVLLIESPLYKVPVSDHAYEIDYLWLSRGVKGKLDEICKTYIFRNLVLDTSLSPYYSRLYRQFADSAGIPVIDMRKTESFVVDLR